MTFVTQIALTPGRETFEQIADPDKSHKHVMSLFPDGAGMVDNARSALGVLYRVDVPRRLRDGDIKVTVQSEIEIDSSSRSLPLLRTGDTIMIASRVNSARRNKKTAFMVKDREADEWARDVFLRSGIVLNPGEYSVGQSKFIGSRGSLGFHTREIVGRAVVRDGDVANEAIRNGIGRGKSYGLGLVSFARIS